MVFLTLPSAGAWAQGTAVQTVDTMNTLWGKHPGMRANHAKGVVVEGRFVPTAAAKKLTVSALCDSFSYESLRSVILAHQNDSPPAPQSLIESESQKQFAEKVAAEAR